MKVLKLRLQNLLLTLRQQQRMDLAGLLTKCLLDYQKLYRRLIKKTALDADGLLAAWLSNRLVKFKLAASRATSSTSLASSKMLGKELNTGTKLDIIVLNELITTLEDIIPRSIQITSLNELVDSAINHYPVNSINFLSIIIRDVLSAIDPKDINLELIATIRRLAIAKLLSLMFYQKKLNLTDEALPEVVKQHLKRRRSAKYASITLTTALSPVFTGRDSQWLEHIMFKLEKVT